MANKQTKKGGSLKGAPMYEEGKAHAPTSIVRDADEKPEATKRVGGKFYAPTAILREIDGEILLTKTPPKTPRKGG